jgi:hypothetical protein
VISVYDGLSLQEYFKITARKWLGLFEEHKKTKNRINMKITRRRNITERK